MSRGWESKNVEEQQSVEQKAAEQKTVRIVDQERQRRVQGLSMQRERILSERTSSAHRRSALENALADVERELEQLGWTIHL
jgi:predicted site-specific integrase-resolvase